MGRKILLVTTDQQRFDTLACNGGTLSRTPVVDGLAADGVRFDRAHPQSVVCMPSRSTILTGQHPSTHGVFMNGVPLPPDAPSVAEVLRASGYRTALVGKAHFEPYFDPFLRFEENLLSTTGTTPHGGSRRGFEHLETASHGAMGPLHYAQWLVHNHPEALGMYCRAIDDNLQVSAEAGGDTGAPQVKVNPIDRGIYHTDWVADRTIDWLDTLDADDDWFCWMSFPDPHHPWDPPESEVGRVDWREVPLPAGYPEDRATREAIIDTKPRHWRAWYDGSLVSNYEAPADWVPATLTADQVREVNARNAVEVELIDEALGRVLDRVAERGWGDDVDVVFTTDHGELQGDFGLLFKGPYHVDGLMRLPLVWRPAPSSRPDPAHGPSGSVVHRPVGLVDLAPTFCTIAGIEPPEWMQGTPLPVDDADAGARGFDKVLTEWDSELFGVDVHLRTMFRDRWVVTTYQPGTSHDGTEGELYDLVEDPLQRVNLWDDPAARPLREDLVADLWDSQPEVRTDRLALEAPV
jgi:arylsulfatase A-like enzyme